MKPKTIVTGALLAFVGVSVAFVVVKEIVDRKRQQESTGPVGGAAQDADADAATTGPQKVIAYYFYGNVRCDNCRKIEAYTGEAILTGFAEALDAGRLEWRRVNVDEPENKHFVKDYELVTRAVVVVDTRGGRQVRWKDLDQVWQMLDQKAVFLQYIRDEVRAYLEETG